MRKWVSNTLIVVAIVLLFGAAMFFGSRHAKDGEEGFVGTDSAATEQIASSNPDYEPWFAPVFEPSSGEVESGLFALQAALGAGVLGFVLGALWQRNRAPHPAGGPSASDGSRTSAASSHTPRDEATVNSPNVAEGPAAASGPAN